MTRLIFHCSNAPRERATADMFTTLTGAAVLTGDWWPSEPMKGRLRKEETLEAAENPIGHFLQYPGKWELYSSHSCPILRIYAEINDGSEFHG